MVHRVTPRHQSPGDIERDVEDTAGQPEQTGAGSHRSSHPRGVRQGNRAFRGKAL